METIDYLPNKILRIEDLTYILPDDFDGDLSEALHLLAEYLRKKFRDGNTVINETDDETSASIFTVSGNRNVDMKYGLFERDETGHHYTIMPIK